MTNATALSAKLRTMGYKPLDSMRAREWGGMNVAHSRGIGGQAQVCIHDGWRDHAIDAKSTAEQVHKELSQLGYRVDTIYGNQAYASFYVSGSPKAQPKPKAQAPKKFTATALREIPNTYIVTFPHRTAWAVELFEDLSIKDFNPDDLRDKRWAIIGTLSDYQRVEGVHSGWVIAVGDDYSDPIRNRDAAAKQWREWLIRRYEERRDEAFLRQVRELEQGIDEAVASERLKNLGQLRTVARNLSAEKFFEWKKFNRLARLAREKALKLPAPDWRKASTRAHELDAKANAIWEDMRVCDSLALYATQMQDEILQRRAS